MIPDYRFSVAPMMDWTDRHCRYFHRQFSANMLLYTEMVTAAALVYGDSQKLLAHSLQEHPLALQLGGSDPALLGKAVRKATPYNFIEINLNVGCPSDRVQSGRFGACLMREPEVVAVCIEAMQAAAGPNCNITVKCRIGVDDQDPHVVLPYFLETVAKTGCKRFIIHARKAWLKGLSPKENRTVPPLDYDLVYKMKHDYPDLEIVLNGGIDNWTTVKTALHNLDGVMVGRNAYAKPDQLLSGVQKNIFQTGSHVSAFDVAYKMIPYIERELSASTRLHQITRHMYGLFAGRAGGRIWRQHFAHARGNDIQIYLDALAVIEKYLDIPVETDI